MHRGLPAVVALALLATLAPPLGVAADLGLAGVLPQVAPGGEARLVAPDGGLGARPEEPPSLDAGRVAFVDRAHRNAVSQQVVVTANGSAGWASWWLNNERVAKYDPLAGRVWERAGKPYGVVHGLGASGSGDVATAAMQFSGPGANQLNTLGLAAQVVAWPQGTGPQPLLTTLHEPCCTVFTDVARGGLAAVAAHMAQNEPGDVGVLTLHGPGMAPLWAAPFSDDLNPAAAPTARQLQGVDISDDGGTVAVTTYRTVFVYRVPLPEPVLVVPNDSQTVARVSGDGRFVAVGGFQSQAYLHAWDGTAYKLQWARNVGAPWVTAVDVADDGSVLVGTFDYRGGNRGLAALLRPDGSTAWTCACYGDYVDDVALTPDGRRAAAVSWGTYGGPGGDVLTAFDAATGAVLFRLADDADEAGSLHAVALSDDGRVALAGGKAVHAREFGNGGMVYGIALG